MEMGKSRYSLHMLMDASMLSLLTGCVLFVPSVKAGSPVDGAASAECIEASTIKCTQDSKECECECDALRESADDQAYVIIFDEKLRTFDYPQDQVLYEDMDVMLCIKPYDQAFRYAVNVGSVSKGNDADVSGITATVSTDLTIALQGDVGIIDTQRVNCYNVLNEVIDLEARKNTKRYDSERDALREEIYNSNKVSYDEMVNSCNVLQDSLSDLVKAAQLVSSIANAAANTMVHQTNGVQNKKSLVEISEIEMPLCKVVPEADTNVSTQRSAKTKDYYSPTINEKPFSWVSAWDPNCTSEGRLPIGAALSSENYSWTAGAISFDNGSNIDIITKNEALKKIKDNRDLVANNLMRMVSSYQRIVAMAADYAKDGGVRRQTHFNLGRYSENTLISGSLTARSLVFNYDEAGTSLVREVNKSTYAFSAIVHKASWWGVQPGFVISTLPTASYELVLATEPEGAAPNSVIQTNSGRFSSLAAFVNFYACPQDLQESIYERKCKTKSDSKLQYAPSFALGVPASTALGEGHIFVGLGLPYIPYLNVVAGMHIGNTTYVSPSVLKTGTASTSMDQVDYNRLAIAPFISINASAEILGNLFPSLKPPN